MVVYSLITLGVTLLTLKLAGVVAWPWVAVLTPIYAVIAIYIFAGIVIGAIALAAHLATRDRT